MTVLEIRITNERTTYTYGGCMKTLARAICKIALNNELFHEALNEAIIEMNEDIEATKVRDEMIGYILKPE